MQKVNLKKITIIFNQIIIKKVCNDIYKCIHWLLYKILTVLHSQIQPKKGFKDFL